MSRIAAKPHHQTDSEEIRAEIRRELDEWIGAINDGNINSVGALYAPDAVLLATFAPEPLTTPGKRRNYFVQFKARKNMTAVVDHCIVTTLGKDAGTASGLYTFSYESENGAPQTVKARFVFVYARAAEGDWLIVAHHSSVVPAVI
jgi:uncharacterized protein (TIGR02246 family)